MLMFSRNNNNGAKSVSSKGTLASQDRVDDKSSVPRRSVLRRAASRPHSWHSTLQKGFQRARSRSSGRGDQNAKNHRASAASLANTNGHYGTAQNDLLWGFAVFFQNSYVHSFDSFPPSSLLCVVRVQHILNFNDESLKTCARK